MIIIYGNVINVKNILDHLSKLNYGKLRYIIYSFKRYNHKNKIDKYIEYPLTLDMNNYNINYNNKNNKYSLNSMAIHSGGLNSGHYYAICKNYLDNKWRQYNDIMYQ